MIESMLDALRPLSLRGKGTLLDPFVPRVGVRTVPVWGSYRMTLDLSNVIHRQIYMGCFGREMTRWTRTLLQPGGTFFDVGAHVGYFTLLAAEQAGTAGRVYGVEPNPAAYLALRRHLEVNHLDRVVVERVALSDAPGTLRLYTPPDSEARDYNVTMMPRSGWTAVDVPCERLDDRLSAWGIDRVDVMKVDVEGAEPRVFAGGVEALREGVVRHLVVEVNGPRLVEGGSSPSGLVDQLASLGFSPARLAGGRAVPVGRSGLDLSPEHEHDRLFVHRSVG